MARISLTTAWTQINSLISENSGLFVSGGTSIELSTTYQDTGIILNRNSFFNVYSSIDTWVRSKTGNATIELETRFLNSKENVIINQNLGLDWILNITEMTLTISPYVTWNSLPNMNGIMSNAVTYLSNYGLEMIPSIRGLSLFDVVNPEQTDSGLAMMIINNTSGGYGLYKSTGKTPPNW